MKRIRLLCVCILASLLLFSLPAAAEGKILIEQFTGTWCGWCPYGAKTLVGLTETYRNDLIIIAYHFRDDMATSEGNELIKVLKPAYPQIALDRMQFPGEAKIPFSRGKWFKAVDYRRGAVGQLEIEPDAEYESSTRRIKLSAKVLFSMKKRNKRAKLDGKFRINVVVTEDHLLVPQKIYGKPYKEIKEYYHDHVVRQMPTGPTGRELDLSMLNEDGVFEIRTQESFQLKENLIERNCHLVIFIHRDTGEGMGPVVAAEKVDLARLLPAKKRVPATKIRNPVKKK